MQMKIIIDIPEEVHQHMMGNDLLKSVHKNICYKAVCNGTPIPNNATNGDVIKAMFPSIKLEHDDGAFVFYKDFDSELAHNFFRDWWNALYQKGDKK